MNSGQILSSLVHSSLKAHCSHSLKFFAVKNHLRNRSLSKCSLLGSRFATRPSQRSKCTEGVARRMRRCIAVQRLSRKYVQKKKTLEAASYRCHASYYGPIRHAFTPTASAYAILCNLYDVIICMTSSHIMAEAIVFLAIVTVAVGECTAYILNYATTYL